MQTEDKLWRREEILQRLRIDTSTLRRWIKDQRWPPHVHKRLEPCKIV